MKICSKLLEPEAGSENRTKNLKEDIHHIRCAFIELKAFTMSEIIEITDIQKYAKKNLDNSSSTSKIKRLIGNMGNRNSSFAGRN